MSVLIEATTLVVRRSRFDALYPGGATAFVRAALDLTPPPRFACADDPQLLNVSFDAPDHAAPAMELLRLAGLRGLENSIPQAVDYALIDQDFTPLPGFSWLAWSKHEDGFTFAWDPAQAIGPVAGPAEWIRKRSDGVEHGVVGDESDHLLLLASEFGAKSYLDFRTGAVIQVDRRSEPAPETTVGRKENGQWGEIDAPGVEDERFGGPLGRLIWCALEELGWRTIEYCRPGLIVECPSEVATYRCRFSGSDELHAITCSVHAPLIIPRRDRRRVMEFITRINVDMTLGAFELNLDNGILGFRSGSPLGDADPSPELVRDLALVGVAMFDRFFARILQVMTGQRPVIESVLHQPSLGNDQREPPAEEAPVQTHGTHGDDRWGECTNPNDTSSPLSLRLRAILSEAGFLSIEGAPSQYMADIVGQLATYHCFFQTQDEMKVITCAVCAPVVVPGAARRAVLELITRINFRLKLGAFEIDIENGLFRFRAGIPLGDTIPDPSMVASIAYIGVAMFDRYWPSILEIVAAACSDVDSALPPRTATD